MNDNLYYQVIHDPLSIRAVRTPHSWAHMQATILEDAADMIDQGWAQRAAALNMIGAVVTQEGALRGAGLYGANVARCAGQALMEATARRAEEWELPGDIVAGGDYGPQHTPAGRLFNDVCRVVEPSWHNARDCIGSIVRWNDNLPHDTGQQTVADLYRQRAKEVLAAA